ncbi:MAG: hypothetical protein COX62_06915 [Deltaproteobacteria bacterium CG_4_10_14_0_2_um_filter_43_8]|nr:MAG: hypothetical protein COV43_05835 [Deltaproteobacteria bacterium CG11_big_fil_rev_8_21_14_0_20_42_23]PJA19321.1 MAG: hypothetical protein COX62_06915 [Deltaproteobacteria bacterium CG_4_10_14_0_2_um_filter_43_8]
MKRIFLLTLLFFSLPACGYLTYNPFDLFDRGSSSPSRVSDPTLKLSLALGGVAPGREELLLIDASGNELSFADEIEVSCTANPDIITIAARDNFSSIAKGAGAKLTPTAEGVAEIRCTENGTELDSVYEVTIPPQRLIQILVAEAATQIADEAETESGFVTLASQSTTAQALASVVKNRIDLILEDGNAGLFGADQVDFEANAPVSYYNAVIEAPNQFSPVNTDDSSHAVYTNAQDRNFLSSSFHTAYDQAVLTAAQIFNGDLSDSTGNAFGFRSPNAFQWGLVSSALENEAENLPDGIGFTDATFPTLSPLQILILPEIWTYSDGRASFIFARSLPNDTNIRVSDVL